MSHPPDSRISLRRPRSVEIIKSIAPWMIVIGFLAVLLGTGLCAATRMESDLGGVLFFGGVLLDLAGFLFIAVTETVDAILSWKRLRAARVLLFELLADAGGRLDANSLQERTGWSIDEVKKVIYRPRRRGLVKVVREGERVVIVRTDDAR